MNSHLVLLGLIITCLPSGKRGREESGIWDRRERVRAETRNDFGLPSTPLTVCIGLEAATVRVRAYTATGAVEDAYNHNKKVTITQGTRLLLTCDVTVLPENSEVNRYRWFHSLTGDSQDRSDTRDQIQDRDPYYRVVHNTLLVDVTSLGQRGRYTCFVGFTNNASQSSGSTAIITVKGKWMHHKC